MANIKDIAKASGVGVSTVSRVINKHPDVKKETREKVLQVIEALNYVPNNSARNLKIANSKNVGIFVRGEYNPFFSEIVETMEKEISAKDYTAMIHFHHCEEDSVEKAAQFVLEKKLVGLIFLGGVIEKAKEKYLSQIEVPIVFASSIIDEALDHSYFSSVKIDNDIAAAEAVNHLIKSGHKRIGMITPDTKGKSVACERYQTYRRILDEHNLDFLDGFVEIGDYTFKSGYDSMCRLLEKKNNITAVFIATDIMAIGAMRAAFDKGYKVPEDISIVGFDGLDYGIYTRPSLTTISQPKSVLGSKAIELLYKTLDDSCLNQHILLETELIIRESSKSIKTK